MKACGYSLSAIDAKLGGIVHSTEVNGLSITYEREGSGPALVLLHGFSVDSRSWWPQLDSLTDRFTIIAWDAPGAGRSSDPDGAFETGDWADCLAALLDTARIEQAFLVGISWGGVVAQEFYRRHPNRTRALVLAGTYAGWKGSLPGAAAEDRLKACLAFSSLPPDEFVTRLLPGMLTASVGEKVKDELARIMSEFHPIGFRLMSESSYPDRREFLPEIRVPTLLIWGDHDARSPVEVAHQFHREIPGSKLEIIPEAGHLSNLEQPKMFDTAVAEFCSSLA